MRGSDIGFTILIIVLVLALMLVNVLYILKSEIDKNWVKYRCNPIVIPFASLFGKNTMQNFTYCIQTIQKNYMSFILAPTHFNLSSINASGKQMTSTLNNIIKYISSLRKMFGGVSEGIFGVFMNLIVEVQRMFVGIGDLTGKLIGLVVTILYIIEGTIMTATSTWSGPIGEAVRDVGRVCFSGNTNIRLKDGSLKNFQNITLGDILADGSEVRGVLALKNWHKDKSKEEYFYTLPNGENNENILVTGHHLIKYNNKYIFVKDHPDAQLTSYKERVVYCLVTSTNTIPIGNYTFWDWEDTPEMNKNAALFSSNK